MLRHAEVHANICWGSCQDMLKSLTWPRFPTLMSVDVDALLHPVPGHRDKPLSRVLGTYKTAKKRFCP